MNEKPKDAPGTTRPGTRTTIRRLLLIAAGLFPISWAINALLIGSWRITIGDEESARHFGEWMIALAGAIAFVFVASVRPGFGPIHRFFSWLLSERIARRGVGAAIWIVTLIVFFYVEENWRGARAWNHYRQQAEAKGAQLDLASFNPQPVPDDQNFAAIPLIKSWFKAGDSNGNEEARKYWEDDYERAAALMPADRDKTNRNFVDLAAWAAAFDAERNGEKKPIEAAGKPDRTSRNAAVPTVLAGLKTNEAALAELAAASSRTASVYPVVYDMENPWGILLPHLGNLRKACRRLELRACAKLASGKPDEALADVKLILYLADSVKEEPFLISYLVRMSCVQLAIQPVWEGLAKREWRDRQLEELEARFQHYNFVTDLKRPADGERAAGVRGAEITRKKGMGFLIGLAGPGQPTPGDKKFANWCWGFIPQGWFYQEQLNYDRLFQKQFDGVLDFEKREVSLTRLESNRQELDRELHNGNAEKTASALLHHRMIAKLLLSSLYRIPPKTVAAQTAVDEARLACALERFRQANGSFPGTLEALEPRFISRMPGEVIGGKPYQYQRTSGGQFVLRADGWNEKNATSAAGESIFDGPLFAEQRKTWEYPADSGSEARP